MKRIKVKIKPLTNFSSTILGETLFGQICWQIRVEQGEDFLRQILQGYTQGAPFLIVSDAFPQNCLPMPLLPSNFWNMDGQDLKASKKKVWIETKFLSKPIRDWKKFAITDLACSRSSVQTHNTIDRYTGTTGTGQFAPFNSTVRTYPKDTLLDVYLLVIEELEKIVLDCIKSIGLFVFGKDASAGQGKFELVSSEEVHWDSRAGSYLTLSSSDLSGMEIVSPTFYKARTHFGRHGGTSAVAKNPFKRPLLLAACAAVITPLESEARNWVGNGISNVSPDYPETVHQGYAITYPLGTIQI